MNGQDEGELQRLSQAECIALLGTQQVGRLGVIAGTYPLIFPVNYAMDHGVIVIRTGEGMKLSHATHANVSFEVDSIDSRNRSGWSVLVRGFAEEITGGHRADVIERTKAADPHPWAPGEHGHWLRLIPEAISGRRILPGELPAIFEPQAYL